MASGLSHVIVIGLCMAGLLIGVLIDFDHTRLSFSDKVTGFIGHADDYKPEQGRFFHTPLYIVGLIMLLIGVVLGLLSHILLDIM